MLDKQQKINVKMIQNGETFDTVNCKIGGAAVPAYLREGLLNMRNNRIYSKQAPDQMQLFLRTGPHHTSYLSYSLH